MPPTGEARRWGFKPGEMRPREQPVEEGDYSLTLRDFGKPGLVGWKTKAGKYPFRWFNYEILDTQSEATGEAKRVREVISSSPDALFRVEAICHAFGYPEEIPEIDLPGAPGDQLKIRAVCAMIDKIAGWVKQNGAVATAHLTVDQYQGRDQQRIGEWHPAGGEGAMEGEPPKGEEPGEEPTEEAAGEEAPGNGSGNGAAGVEEALAEAPPRQVARAPKPAARVAAKPIAPAKGGKPTHHPQARR